MHYGFTITCQNKRSTAFSPIEDQDYLSYDSQLEDRVFQFTYLKNNHFEKEKLFFETEDYICGIDGVLLNLSELLKKHHQSSWNILFPELIHKYKYLIPNELIGEFSGFFFIKKTEELCYFTNQTASKKIFYFQDKELFIIAPSLQTISKFIRHHGKQIQLNRAAAYSMLTFGSMHGNHTLMDGVFKLHGGEYLLLKGKELFLEKYLDYNAIEVKERSKKDTIEHLELTFQEAIRLEYEKDKAYGLQHLATLSGGLDSRMTVFLAHKAGYKNTNLCFSQKGYDDELIAKAIAKHLDQEFKFIPLDGGDYVFDFEENMEIFEGQVFYPSSAHFNFAIKKIDLSPFGLIHTGLLGDGVLGTHITKPTTGPPNLRAKLISKKLFPKIETTMEKLAKEYVSEDVFYLHQRFFNLIISGAQAMQKYTYLVSPFMSPDFIKLCLSIPAKDKYQQKIYLQWINQNHTDLTNFKWESIGMKPKYTWQKPLSRYTKKASSIWYRLQGKSHKLNMTPYEYWVKSNPKILAFMTSLVNQKMTLLQGDKELSKDANHLFFNGNALEKTLVMTLLGAIDQLKITI